MGEETAGTDAVRIACARIAAGQGDLVLVGGSYNAQRPDVLLHYEMGGLLWKQPFEGVWSRQARAAAWSWARSDASWSSRAANTPRRGAPRRWRISPQSPTGRCRRRPGEATANAERN